MIIHPFLYVIDPRYRGFLQGLVMFMVSGIGTIEKRETLQTQVYQYLVAAGKQIKIEFELPYNISSLETGQKVKVSISTTRPKKTRTLLTLRGDVYQIEKTSAGTKYIVFFSGLQGSITAKRTITGIKAKKPVYISISN